MVGTGSGVAFFTGAAAGRPAWGSAGNATAPATVGQAKALTPVIAAMSLARCRSPAPIAHDAKKVRRFIVTPPRC